MASLTHQSSYLSIDSNSIHQSWSFVIWVDRVREICNSMVSAIVGNVVSAIFTFLFAAVGIMLGAMTGAFIGQETESGFFRGAAVGAISGAVFSIEVFEYSLLLWQSDDTGIGCLLYLVDVIANLLNGRLVREQIGPAMLSAVQSQMDAMERSFDDAADIFLTCSGVKGLSGDSVERIPTIKITTKNLIDGSGEKISCPVCLQAPSKADRFVKQKQRMVHIEKSSTSHGAFASRNAYESILKSLPKHGGGEFGKYYSLPALEDTRIDRLPYSIRILLESAIRNCDEFQVKANDVEKIIDWENSAPKQVEIPFKPARVLLQDFTGVPAVVDLASMRDAMNKLGSDPNKINPLVPVDLVIDHSVQVDVARSENAVQQNMELEFQRNKERFGFLKWGSNAFHNMLVVPPGSGIVHQVNLEYLGRVVFNSGGLLYPDSVVGTDSHTTMIDGLGVAGWGVGGIEAEAAMLGQPMSMVLPGEGMAELSLADRATIANMSPEYGATMGFFPVDHVTLQYLKLTGRSEETVSMIESYLRANKMFVDYNEPQTERVYSSYLELQLEDVEPCVSGPKRPHDRVPLKEMKVDWHACLDNRVGFKLCVLRVPKEAQAKVVDFSFHGTPAKLKHGDVVIAAITSCTNTSNPSVMLGAALVAKKACELGLEVKPWIKTSLAPGSGVVKKYLEKSGLQKYLNHLGFHIVGYGCTTCIGNSGDLDESVASAISENDIVAAAVLSGNRNFEGRVHPLTRANYLASPPLVVAYALAGTVDIDFETEPIGVGKDGKDVFFRDIWPSNEEIADIVQSSVLPDMFRQTYEAITKGNPMWNQLTVPSGTLYSWDPTSTYIHDPPYFKDMTMSPPGAHGVKDAFCLLNFGDSITTDHISPAGSIHKDSPAAKYLMDRGVDRRDFNSYGSRRGNDEVMARGTFANIRIVNKFLNGEVGPKTIHVPTGEKLSVFDAATRYKSEGHDTIILAGAEYGSGSSRDWAAKGPMLLGVKAVIAKSFERIHRSNLVGMGIIPLCFKAGEDADSLGLTGYERYSIDLPSNSNEIRPGQDVVVVTDNDKSFTCTIRFDTEVELAYFDHGGILPYVIRNLINSKQ
ncbi:hypothetical protein Scep_000239 [Stephania cephalantha]|uniref:aconitate hydratase n=1 Tax=Stephania cephalantha TaxID=152367 RepID=A0AAP0L780_9MAGN